MLRDLPPRMMRELEDWAALRRTTPEAAAVELLRVALHVPPDRQERVVHVRWWRRRELNPKNRVRAIN